MNNLAFSPMFVLYVVIVFSFIVTSVFMFAPKNDERVHIIFFWLGVALAFLTTFLSATSFNNVGLEQALIVWGGLIFAAAGVLIRMITGKTNSVANVLVMVSTVYGAASFFILN